MTNKFLAAALAAASLMAAAPAVAAPQDAQFSIAVPIAGLDLSTAEGQRALAARAEAAAVDICGPAINFRPTDQAASNECRAAVRTAAKEEAVRRTAIRSQQIASR